jgi:tungstate transport system substrate-binding protein
MRSLCIILLVSCILAFSGCGKKESGSGTIKMATTTSTDNSGLLDSLLPEVRKQTGIEVQIIATGTGKAIKHGEHGDVDVIFVHAEKAEEKFVKDGFGIKRVPVMYNDFVIIGPDKDPAGVKGSTNAARTLKKIFSSKSSFISRGDDSGTHKKEISLWADAGVKPDGAWYMSAGQGMGAVLIIANEKQAYTLTDRGTFIAFEDKIKLKIMCEGDPKLFNPYAVIAVNPEKHPHVKKEAVLKFIDFLVSKQGQEMIRGFRKKGKQLFIPCAE